MKRSFYDIMKRDQLVYEARSQLAGGNINPDSDYVAINQLWSALFFNDEARMVIVFPNRDEMEKMRISILQKRGISALIYDDIFTSYQEDKFLSSVDSNFRASWSSFFFGSMQVPHSPFIMLTTTKSEVAYFYFLKFGMSVLKKEGMEVPYYDYVFKFDSEVHDLITRPIYVTSDKIGQLHIDSYITPDVTPEHFIKYVKELGVQVKEKFGGSVTIYQYDSVVKHKPLALPVITQALMMQDGNKFFYLNVFEASTMLLRNQALRPDYGGRVNMVYKRKFIVAPTGSGKTFFIRSRNVGRDETNIIMVDADDIFKWPKKPIAWWEDPILRKEVYDENTQIMKDFLSGPKDGKVIFFADDMDGNVTPDAVVLIPDEVHRAQLMNIRKGQPGIERWNSILEHKVKLHEKYHDRIFDNFSQATGYVIADGRSQLPRFNRFSWRVVFEVERQYFPDFHIQSLYSGQTFIVKSLTYTISRVLHLGVNDMEVFRRIALLEGGAKPTFSNRVSGIIRVDGNLLPIAVSGHTVNYCLLRHFIPLDYSRLLTHVEWNAQLYSTRRKLTLVEKMFATEGYLAERMNITNISHLWHNVPEWVFGYYAGRVFSSYLGLTDVSKFEIDVFLNFMKALVHTYGKPVYEKSEVILLAEREGWIVKNWTSEVGATLLTNWSLDRW